MENKKRNTLIILALIILIGITASFLFSKKSKEKNLSSSKIIPSPSKEKNLTLPPASEITSPPIFSGGGFMTLKTKIQKNTFLINEPLSLLVIADSSSQPITGYDVVLTFDPQKLDLVSEKNLVDKIQIFTHKKEGKVFITGTKKLAVGEPLVFSGTPILELVFQPKQKGKTEISFDFQPQSTKDSNLISDKTQDILEKVEGISLEISQ